MTPLTPVGSVTLSLETQPRLGVRVYLLISPYIGVKALGRMNELEGQEFSFLLIPRLRALSP